MITLLLPTMNRSDFLVRLIRYYADLRFSGVLLIGDSSNAAHLARAKAAIRQYGNRLNIVHQEYPGLNNAQCIHLMLDRVNTPFAAFVADDDLLVPRALDRCIGFLERNPDYSAAHGIGISIQLGTSGPYGEPVSVNYYDQAEVEGKTARERLDSYAARSAGTQFSVHRTSSWRTMYRDVTTIKDIAFGTETLPCYLTVMLGKVKALDGLYLVRQLHDQQYIYRSEAMEWITSPEWFESFQAFCNSVAKEMALQDGISEANARDIVREHYRAKLRAMLSTPGTSSGWRASIRRWLMSSRPGSMLVRFRQRWIGKGAGISLRSMLDPSSPYHGDFMDIYRAFKGYREPDAVPNGPT